MKLEKTTHSAPVGVVVQILGPIWMWHTCGITTYDVEVGTRGHSCFGVPLHLRNEKKEG